MPVFLLLFAIVTRQTGVMELPAGDVSISSEVRLPDGAHDLEVRGKGTVLHMVDGFNGAGAIVCTGCRNVTIRDVRIVGGKASRAPIAPYDKAFVDYYRSNGIVIQNGSGINIENVTLERIPNFAVIVSASRKVLIEKLTVESSGSSLPAGRNNTTGGVLLEEGTTGFIVRQCRFRQIRGNGVWTHSRYTSARNADGVIAENHFDTVGRDAIQVGHATNVRVERNTGAHIGYPADAVDPNGMPVAIDTAGNVDKSLYSGNHFEEINGKCIDLDGFHDGEVSRNVCVNKGKPEDYAFGHFGIVFNNTNPDMQSRNIRVVGNTIDGTKYGGIFVIGEGHTIQGNTLTRLNLAHCNETHAKFGCIYLVDEPDLLRTGIYFGRKAERPDPARRNTVRDNVVSGHGMEQHCFGFAPGILRKDQTFVHNRCKDE